METPKVRWSEARRAGGPLLGALLRDVSRSFYLTLRVLPGVVRPAIGLAYLLARTTDTLADTAWVEPARRLALLDDLGEAIAGRLVDGPDLAACVRDQGVAAERCLLARSGEALVCLRQMPPLEQRLIREVLATILSGQRLDVERFADASATRIRALATADQLDDYTYRVAGCVGEFWTRLCRARLFPRAPLDEDGLVARGIRFGRGLQLVNILRDLAADLRQGRCYLPADRLRTVGLAPEDLRDPRREPRMRPVYDAYLDQADAHLRAGGAYTLALPATQVRVRLACAWPILIAHRTLARLRTGAVLDPDRRLKITRAEVRSVMLRSVLYYPWPPAWRRLFPAAPPETAGRDRKA